MFETSIYGKKTPASAIFKNFISLEAKNGTYIHISAYAFNFHIIMRSLLLCLASISFIVPIESYLNQIQPQKAQLQFGQTSPSSFFKLHLSTPTASQLYPEADCLETGDCPLDFYENSDVDVNIKNDNMLHNIQSDDLQLILRGCG